MFMTSLEQNEPKGQHEGSISLPAFLSESKSLPILCLDSRANFSIPLHDSGPFEDKEGSKEDGSLEDLNIGQIWSGDEDVSEGHVSLSEDVSLEDNIVWFEDLVVESLESWTDSLTLELGKSNDSISSVE